MNNNNKTLPLAGPAPCGSGRQSTPNFSGVNARASAAAYRGDATTSPLSVRALRLERIEARRAARNHATHAATLGRLRSRRRNRWAANWPVGMALLAVTVLWTAMGITAAIAPVGNRAGSDPTLAQVATIANDADDYVEALARIGVTHLPGPSTSPAQ